MCCNREREYREYTICLLDRCFLCREKRSRCAIAMRKSSRRFDGQKRNSFAKRQRRKSPPLTVFSTVRTISAKAVRRNKPIRPLPRGRAVQITPAPLPGCVVKDIHEQPGAPTNPPGCIRTPEACSVFSQG